MTAPPPPAPGAARTLRLGDLLVGLGGLLVVAFSFAPFVEYGESAALLFGLLDISLSFNAWSPETFMVPLTTFVVLAALLGIAAVAVRFGLRQDPSLLGFRLRQLEVGLALFGFTVLLGMIASDKHAVLGSRRLAEADPTFRAEEFGLDTGWGAVLMLIGAAFALAGALLNHFGIGPTIPAGSAPEPPAEPGPPTHWRTGPPAAPEHLGPWQPGPPAAPEHPGPWQPGPPAAPEHPGPWQPGPPSTPGHGQPPPAAPGPWQPPPAAGPPPGRDQG